jgi:hypothetical protein
VIKVGAFDRRWFFVVNQNFYSILIVVPLHVLKPSRVLKKFTAYRPAHSIVVARIRLINQAWFMAMYSINDTQHQPPVGALGTTSTAKNSGGLLGSWGEPFGTNLLQFWTIQSLSKDHSRWRMNNSRHIENEFSLLLWDVLKVNGPGEPMDSGEV